ncbi:MAG: energy transducer TonB [Burkholderiales bacterium]|nr:energy transducer TonB [Burkholderiales bacterium]
MSKPRPSPQGTAPVEAVKTVPSEPVADAPATADASAQPAAPSQAGSALPRSTGVTTETPAKSVSQVDSGTLEIYRRALIEATRRYKRYPGIAMEKGWQGKVEVHMVIGANGMLARTSIKTSSGHEVLDNQAVSMLKKGKTTVQIPPGLRGREFSIDVPVIFSLDNPNS